VRAVQLDGVLPGRLDASYVTPDGNHAVPLMIHYAAFGSLGRFGAILLEYHGGTLPLLLSPDQMAVARSRTRPAKLDFGRLAHAA
jgi:threonyl-tRNA synthetase